VNKISGYILATKTLRTKRIVRITNHKTHKNRTYNTLYKHLHECKRRVGVVRTGYDVPKNPVFMRVCGHRPNWRIGFATLLQQMK